MKARDPVCGVEIDVTSAPASSSYGGEIYYFCCQACQERFDRNPERYVNPGQL